MSIVSSLYTGISGLSANGTAMSIIGDNIANTNTVGFKSGRASFGDVLSQNLVGSAGNVQIGRGVMLTGVDQVFTQGSFQSTESGLDIAIDGDGFFLVKDAANNGTYYTRAGQFNVDKSGFLVNPEGYRVQGYQASATGAITSSLGDLSLSSTFIAPIASTIATVSANLDAGSSIIVPPFNPADPTTYNFSTGITIYDSLGQGHLENAYFRKTAVGPPSTWNVYAPGSTAGNAAIGALTFDAVGQLTGGSPIAANFAYLGGPLSFDFGLGTSSAATQYAAPSAVLSQSSNGYPSGSLTSVSIDQSGLITGLFSNGITRGIGEIALGKFQNPNGLMKYGRNLYVANLDSGQATVGAPGTGGYGRTLSNSLELSNVDIAREFVNMITAQRGFQASSKIITTSDEMMSDIINLKR